MAQQAYNFLVDHMHLRHKCPTTSAQSLDAVTGHSFLAATLDVLVCLHITSMRSLHVS